MTSILCFIGCVYQTINLNVIYFSYETTTNVRYETQTDTYLPAITVSFHAKNKWKQFKTQFIENVEGDPDGFIGHMTIQEQLGQLQLKPYIVPYCFVTLISGLVECQGASNYSHYINQRSYSFTIFPQLNEEPDDNFKLSEIEQFEMKVFLVIIAFRKEHGEDREFFIDLHQRDYVFYKNGASSLFINSNKTNRGIIEYNVVIVKYMFEPFGGCFDGQTGEHCIDKCVIEGYIAHFGEYPGDYFTKDKLNLKFSPQIFSTQSSTERCKVKCNAKKVCYQQHFISRYVNVDFDMNFDQSYIFIKKPTIASTIYEISLKMSVEEYLCLMSSIFSLWFGFSILMFTDFCRLLFIKFKF